MLKKIRKNISKFIFNNFSFLWIFLLDRKNQINIDRLDRKRVLISDCEKIGNYIFKTPLIRGLKKDGFHITVMGSHVTKELLEADPYIDDAIITSCYRKKSSDIFTKTAVALKYRRSFSHYIEPVGCPYFRELLFMRLLSPESIIGRERKKGLVFKIINLAVKDQGHHIDNSLKLLEVLGLNETREYHLGLKYSSKYDNLYKNKPLILYNGKASTKSRSFDHSNEKLLIDYLSNLSYINFKKIEREESIHDLTGLMKQADLIITVDTGISHLASALNKPIIINSYNSSVAPISSLVIKSNFNPASISSILESIFLPSDKKVA